MLATPELLQEAAQPERLIDVVSRSGDIPLYRTFKSETSEPLSHLNAMELHRWPLITKQDIRRDFPANFLGTGASLEELVEQNIIELEHTSGTSEERTALLLPCGWWLDQELRALNLNAFVAEVLRNKPEARRATINSPVCSGDIRYTGVPSLDERVLGNTLFVSLSRYPFLWSGRDLERIAGEIVQWEPDFLDVDPVYGVIFALYCEQHGIRLPSVQFIVCSYEFVSSVHRSILNRVFGVPVFDLYGSTETGHLLMEDSTGQMRPSLETAYFELLEVDALGIGDLVVTTLTNPFMPLIRYRIGDLVERSDSPYGSRYVLHGRTADAFQTFAGKRVTTRQIDQCFAGLAGIAHYQLIQRDFGNWLLRLVPDGNRSGPGQLAELQERLRAELQTSEPVSIQKTHMLVPENSGKFRLGYPMRRA